jgi:hypothetical protein
MVVLPDLGPFEFPPRGTDLTTQAMSSTISLLMVIAKPFCEIRG